MGREHPKTRVDLHSGHSIGANLLFIVFCQLSSRSLYHTSFQQRPKFDRPDRLILDRANNKHFGFGSGIHYCLGAPLARLEASIAFKVLFDRLPHLRLAVAPERLQWNSGLVTRGMKAIPVAF